MRERRVVAAVSMVSVLLALTVLHGAARVAVPAVVALFVIASGVRQQKSVVRFLGLAALGVASVSLLTVVIALYPSR